MPCVSYVDIFSCIMLSYANPSIKLLAVFQRCVDDQILPTEMETMI